MKERTPFRDYLQLVRDYLAYNINNLNKFELSLSADVAEDAVKDIDDKDKDLIKMIGRYYKARVTPEFVAGFLVGAKSVGLAMEEEFNEDGPDQDWRDDDEYD